MLLWVPTSPAMASDGELQPFHSDGCSVFPDGTLAQPRLWCGCCVAHDLAYWQGGTEQARREADARLNQCVKDSAGSEALGRLMEIGVRAGGQPQLPSSFRWGYGWPWRKGYVALTEADQMQIRQRLEQHSYAVEMQLRCAAPATASETR